jgi:hypothetical protein
LFSDNFPTIYESQFHINNKKKHFRKTTKEETSKGIKIYVEESAIKDTE